MKVTKSLLTATAFLFHAIFVHAETIEMPIDFQVESVYRHLANLPPDFELYSVIVQLNNIETGNGTENQNNKIEF